MGSHPSAWSAVRRVCGSKARDGNGDLLIQPALDVFDDGPEKPVRIWNRIGRRPILAAGNSNGDDEMLMYSGRPGAASLRLLVLHDDDEREFAYTAGAERALEHAETVWLDRRQHAQRLGDRLQ